METSGVIDLCSRIEDLVYHDALKEFNIPESVPVWNKRECMIYYQEKCDQIIRSLEYKPLNWKKCFDDYEKNPRHLLNTLLRTTESKATKRPPPTATPGDPFKKLKSRVPKAPPKKVAAAPKTTSTKKKSSVNAAPLPAAPKAVVAVAAAASNSSKSTKSSDNKTFDLPMDPVIESSRVVEGLSTADLGIEDEEIGLFDFNMDEDADLANIVVDEDKWK